MTCNMHGSVLTEQGHGFMLLLKWHYKLFL